MYNLKKLLSLIIILLMALQGLSSATYAADEVVLNPNISIENGAVTISQNLGSAYSGKNVSMLLLPDATNVETLTPALFGANTAFINQTKVTDGNYSFTFEKPAEGNYTLTINIVGGASVYTADIAVPANDTNLAELTLSSVFGHIYYDYSNIPITARIIVAKANQGGDIKARITLAEYNGSAIEGKSLPDGVAFYTQEFPVTVEENGILNTTHNVNLTDSAKQFGIFTLKYEVYDGEALIAQDTDRISVINAPNGEVLNNKIGVQQNYTEDGTLQEWFGLKHIGKVEELFTSAGFGVTRQDLTWHTFEKKRGAYALTSQIDEFYTEVMKNGNSPFLILRSDNSLYRGTAPTQKANSVVEQSDHLDPDYLAAFGNYAKAVAEKTVAVLGEGNSYEIYNEYNIKQFNVLNSDGTKSEKFEKSTPQGYLNLLKAAYSKIKEADPKAKIYGMATAHVINDNRSDYSTYQWLNEVLSLGAAQYVDGISVHIYTQKRTPETSSGTTDIPESDKAAILARYREIIDTYKPGAPIVLSETGYSSNNEIASTNGDNSTPEVKQAKYAIRDLARLYDGVEKFIWFTSLESPVASSYEHHLGLLRIENNWTDGTVTYNSEIPFEAKPAFLAFANWNKLLGNAELLAKTEKAILTSGNTGYNYKFRTADGNIIYVLWSSNDVASGDINLDFGTNTVYRYDMYGNKTKLTSPNGSYTLTLTGEPIYVEVLTDYRIEVKNQNGIELFDSFDESVTSVTAKLLSSVAPQNEMMILATYKDNILRDVTMGQNSDDGVELSLSISDDDTIKAFLFESLSGLKPIIENLSLSKIEANSN